MSGIKRIISLGLDKPSILERDVIYVSFPARGNKIDSGIDAVIQSTTPFSYPTRPYSYQTKEQLELTLEKFNPDGLNRLLDELVALNNGKVDYSRVLKESVYPLLEALIKDMESRK